MVSVEKLEDWDWCNNNYDPENMGQGSTAVLGPPDVVEVLNGKRLQLFRLLAKSAIGGKAWSLTALGLVFCAFPIGLLEYLTDAGFLFLSPVDWPPLLKPILNSLRRTAALHPVYGVSKDDTFLLRKLGNCCLRSRDEADWEAEFSRRTVNTPVHQFPMADGTLSRYEWLFRLNRRLQQLTDTSVDMILSTARLEPWDEWWASRAKWAPKGSSDTNKAVQEYLEHKGMVLDASARAGKKSMMAVLPELSPRDFLSKMPGKYPRASTKCEPGGKQRALYAQDDFSFIVSSYPNVAVEKYINFDGIYAQQSPVDVANWVRNHIIGTRMKRFNISLDYSDFNSDHEVTALFMLDRCWSKSWLRLGNGDLTCQVKSACCSWAALAHLNSWVKNPLTGDPTRIMGGLFSGDRNTARDNSMLHAAYSSLMRDAAAGMSVPFELINPAYTGDDEDTQFERWPTGMVYLVSHILAGFSLTSHKQLAGITSHEYLQRILSDDCIPRRPICAAMAQLCSGNWYQTNYVWFDGIIQSVNDNLWELHTRGLPLLAARTLAKRVLNRAMRVRSGEGWVKLEWWKFRSCGAFHPLWGVTTLAAPAAELGSAAVQVIPRADGVAAWCAKASKRFGKLLNASKMKMYERDLQRDCFGELFPRERNRAMHHDVQKSWPQRLDPDPPVTGGVVHILTEANLLAAEDIILGGVIERHPRTVTELISRFGLDPQLYAMIGGREGLLAVLPPRDLAQWESIVAPSPIPLGWHWLDPALRSWASNFSEVPRSCQAVAGHKIRLPPLAGSNKQMGAVTVIYAGNGAGKTTFGRQFSSKLVLDFDDLVRAADCMSAVKKGTRSGWNPAELPALIDRLACVAASFEFSILTCQYPWILVSAVLEAARLQVASIYAVRTAYAVTAFRLIAERFWTTEKLQKRYARYSSTVSTLPVETKYINNIIEALPAGSTGFT